MILHKKPTEFAQAIRKTSSFLEIRDDFIEKDYWITYVLRNLSLSKFRHEIVFKGGTSLSKAFDAIKRFSEDIDIVLAKKEPANKSQKKKMFQDVEKALMASPLVKDKGYGKQGGSDFRSKRYRYPKTMESSEKLDSATIANTLLLEINGFAKPSGGIGKTIESYVAKYVRDYDKTLIAEYGLEPFEVTTLAMENTLVEKILCLSRLSIEDDESFSNLKDKNRHFYDIHALLKEPKIKNFVTGFEFENLLNDTMKSDCQIDSYKQTWARVESLDQAPLFGDVNNIFSKTKISFDKIKPLLYEEDSVSWTDIQNSFEGLSKALPAIAIPPLPCDPTKGERIP